MKITQDQIQHIVGATAYDRSGDKIGRIGQVYLDDETDQPTWATVRTGLFGTSESFVPLHDATPGEGGITVPFEKSTIKGAPNIADDAHLSPAEEDELYRYYGIDTAAGTARGRHAADTDTGTGADTGLGRDTAVGRDADAGTAVGTGTATRGRDTSGPTTDNAMTRSEERLNVGTQTQEAGRARLRKYVVTEHQQVQVPVSREEVTIEREPITEANRGAAHDGPAISEEEHEITLRAERPVVETEAVPVERVRLGTETVTEQETVGGEVRREEIDLDTDVDADRTRR